jgi:hypothetical protein
LGALWELCAERLYFRPSSKLKASFAAWAQPRAGPPAATKQLCASSTVDIGVYFHYSLFPTPQSLRPFVRVRACAVAEHRAEPAGARRTRTCRGILTSLGSDLTILRPPGPARHLDPIVTLCYPPGRSWRPGGQTSCGERGVTPTKTKTPPQSQTRSFGLETHPP